MHASFLKCEALGVQSLSSCSLILFTFQFFLSSLMKCLNMKISHILIFIWNFVTISQMNIDGNKTSQATLLVDEQIPVNKFGCPQLFKIIYHNNITDHLNYCKTIKAKESEINVEVVLQHACLIVNDMLNFMCEHKFNITSDLLKVDNYSSICPFNFSHLKELGFKFKNEKVVNELTQIDHCKKVCSDLYSNRTQCIMLSKINYFLMSSSSPVTEKASLATKVDKHPAKYEQTESSGYLVTPLQEKNGKLTQIDTKTIIVKENLEVNANKFSQQINATKTMKDTKTIEKPVISSTTKVELKSSKSEALGGETKISENENNIQENIKIKSNNEDLNEEEQSFNDNDINPIDDSSDKTDSNQILNLPKIDNFEDKIESSLKGKEIYSGEGFFQTEDSHFFFYFIMVSSVIVVGYLAFHNKNKILAYALEGTSGRRSRRRPNPARYRKLETNLEEVISSNATSSAASSVVY